MHRQPEAQQVIARIANHMRRIPLWCYLALLPMPTLIAFAFSDPAEPTPEPESIPTIAPQVTTTTATPSDTEQAPSVSAPAKSAARPVATKQALLSPSSTTTTTVAAPQPTSRHRRVNRWQSDRHDRGPRRA